MELSTDSPTETAAIIAAPRSSGAPDKDGQPIAHDGSVFGCNGAKRTLNSRPGILWYEVRISDGVLVQEGFVDDPNCDYVFPWIAVDIRGNIDVQPKP